MKQFGLALLCALCVVLLAPLESAKANEFQKSSFITGARLGYAAHADTDDDRARRRARHALKDALNRVRALEHGLSREIHSKRGHHSPAIANYVDRLEHALSDGPHYRNTDHKSLRKSFIAVLNEQPYHTEDGSLSWCSEHVLHIGYSIGVLLAWSETPDQYGYHDRHGKITGKGWHFFKYITKWSKADGRDRYGNQCPTLDEQAFYSLALAEFRGRSIPLTRETNLMARRDFDRMVQLIGRAYADTPHHDRYERPRGGYDWDNSDGRYWDRDWEHDHSNGRDDDWRWSRDWNWDSEHKRYGQWDREDDRNTDRYRRFDSPTSKGKLIDQCLYWGRECGKPAADKFCRKKDYREAVRFNVERARPTWVMGDKRVCDAPYCAGFTEIVCTR